MLPHCVRYSYDTFQYHQLTTFATVIEYGTFDAAAGILRVSPSAVSPSASKPWSRSPERFCCAEAIL